MKSLTKDVDLVVASVADSEVVKISDDKKRIKRRNPLPEEDTLIKRSIYAVRLSPISDSGRRHNCAPMSHHSALMSEEVRDIVCRA